MATKTVTTIPPTISRFTATPLMEKAKRKVAGYARVSSDHDDQFTSYEAQIDYYTNYIKSRDNWQFISVYTEEERSYPVLFQMSIARHYTNDEQ